jgi:hypothetical protein
MTIRVSKQSINVEDKLSDLDYAQIPYEKMPPGSVLQIATIRHKRASIGSNLNDTSFVEITGGTHADSDSENFEITIYPRLPTSRIIIQGSSHFYITSNATANDWSGVIYKISKYVDGEFVRDLSDGGDYDESIYVTETSMRSMGNKPIFAFDNPGTTGRVTYKVLAAAQTTNAQIQIHHAAHGPGGYLMATEIKQ